jgi:hypothetical protein
VPSAKLKTPVTWEIKDGVMTARSNGIRTKRAFGDITLHVEWRSAAGYDTDPKKKSQGNSNSGIFFMKTYELQVLDCYKTETYADGMTAAIYGQQPPAFNACLPSRTWNSYDIEFTAPRFNADGSVASKTRITVVMNGVKVQDGTEYIGPSSHKKNPPYVKHADKLPLGLQLARRRRRVPQHVGRREEVSRPHGNPGPHGQAPPRVAAAGPARISSNGSWARVAGRVTSGRGCSPTPPISSPSSFSSMPRASCCSPR